jgi:hypothetical protein
MRSYDEIVRDYQKRQRDTLIDSLAVSLNYMDEICVEAGVLDQAGILDDLLNGAFTALPFVLIAVTEQFKVILKRKPAQTGLKDAAFRMVKTGAAMGVGAFVAGAAGIFAAIPVSVGVRALFDRYRLKMLTGRRVMVRTQRLHEMHTAMVPPIVIHEQPLLTEGTPSLPGRE